jgi:hypothetical protein
MGEGMTDLEKAARLTLDALEDAHANHNITYAGAISALRAALAQQAEPVADKVQCDGGTCGAGGYCGQCPWQQAEPVVEQKS